MKAHSCRKSLKSIFSTDEETDFSDRTTRTGQVEMKHSNNPTIGNKCLSDEFKRAGSIGQNSTITE